MSNTKVKSTQVKSNELSTNELRVYESLKAVMWAFLIGIFLVVATGQASELLTFFNDFFKKNFANVTALTDFLSRMSYFVPLGLSLAVAFRMGIFNIGASGQAFGGGAFAFFVATKITVGPFGWVISLFAGIMFGMLLALLIAFLKNNFRINEVISSIMFNWIMFYFVMYLSKSGVSSPLVENDLRMDWLSDWFSSWNSDAFINASPSTNVGIIFILPLVIILAWAYKHTKWGFKQELIGNNPNTGKYLGINSKREIYKTMAISGALAGLAGTIYFLGVNENLPDAGSTNDIPAWTFDGITIALLGFSSPIGVLLSSMVYALFNPAIDATIGSYGIINIMVAVMIVRIAMSNYRIQYGKRNATKVKSTKDSKKGGDK